jgi:hypothetical protein
MRKAEPAPYLLQRLEQLAALLGPLPHDRLNLADDPLTATSSMQSSLKLGSLNGHTTQSTRMLKATCPDKDCKFLVRVAGARVREIGPPHCPKHGAMVVIPNRRASCARAEP